MIETILETVGRTAVVYIVILAGLRILGKRHVAQLSLIDLVLILLISNAVQNAMVGPDTSLIGGIIAAITLLIMSYFLTWVLYRYRPAEKLFEPNPLLLIHNGKIIQKNLDAEKISGEELERAVREHGISSIKEVKIAVIEADGTVSVVQKTPDEKRIESFKHRRTKSFIKK
ncbi:MAG: YetF domain-containing protein [Bacteroidota bacterium]